MSIHMEKDKNGKFTPKMAEYVLMVNDRYSLRLKYHMNELKTCKSYFDRIKVMAKDEDYDDEDLMEMFSANNQLHAVLTKAVYELAKDLYEFYYLTESNNEDELFYSQLYIDQERFEKERVPEKEFKKILKDKYNISDRILMLFEKNKNIYLDCLSGRR